MKTVLLRSVSHELRTPLNAITFFTNEVKDESAEISVADKEKLHIVSISAKLVLTLIDDLMDYSKMLSGVFSVNKSNCNIREIIYKTSDLIKYQAIKKNLGIYIRIDPETPNTVYTDSLRLSQILLNLLSNALKFTLRGNIEICLAMCTEDRIKIYVQDTGIGIQDAIKTKLFTEFNTSNIQNINPQGSGLGLSISNVLAKELGGKPIKVKSKVGKGSIFRFSINTKIDTNAHSHYDLVEMAESENCFPIHIPYYDTTRKRIDPQVLIVDDNEFNRIILCTILKKFNIEFSEACSGKEAIEKIIKQDKLGKPFKAIIMDCMMPELNGWETTAALHVLAKQGKISRFPNVIGHSAFTNDEDKKMCFNCGMLDHLEKPSTPDKIMSTLKRFIYD